MDSACQASLSITNSQSLLKLMPELVIPSNHLILCHPLLLPSILPSTRDFSNESVLQSGGQSIGASASASVLWMNIQDWFLLGLTGLISLQSKVKSLWLCESQQTVDNSSRDGNTRPPYPPPEKSIFRSRSNRKSWTWNNGLVPSWERSRSRLYIVTLLI